MPTVGFIGLGNMGSRMVRHLVDAGHDVAVHDLDASAVANSVAAGARAASSAGAVAVGADIVFLSLPTPAIVDRVVGEVLANAEPGLVIVDHSTIDPGTTRMPAGTA